MSKVLNAIGVVKDVIMHRRKSFMFRESLNVISDNPTSWEVFHFGSQTEGTTTPGLQSDIDVLRCDITVNVMIKKAGMEKILKVNYNEHVARWCDINAVINFLDWKAGMLNVLMLWDENTTPQQYLVQIFKENWPAPETFLCDPRFVRKATGEILLSSERVKDDHENEHKNKYGEVGHFTKQGPSVSYLQDWDMVYALPIKRQLQEIQHWVDKKRPRHWPSKNLLEAARVTACFLVPVGHADSNYKRDEWRLSANLIERMLMFSLNITQIKCYVVLKMIKKTLFSKIVNDGITSFHCKNILFFTIEGTCSSLWKENNLMFLLLMCLHALRKMLKVGIFPHYIIQGVNLFDGKITFKQQRRLLQYVESMIANNLKDLVDIEVDDFGVRLSNSCLMEVGKAGRSRRSAFCKTIILHLEYGRWSTLLIHLRGFWHEMYDSNSTINIEQFLTKIMRTCIKHLHNVRLKRAALELIKHFFALHISLNASRCLRFCNKNIKNSIHKFRYCLNTDLASMRLKVASVLYCSGHLRAASVVLEDVEKRYHKCVKAICGVRDLEHDNDLNLFAHMVSGAGVKGWEEAPFAFCVKFVPHEAFCVPYILLYEMARGESEEEVAQRNYYDKRWMNCAEVDARVFLYYMQYLTYGGLRERKKQLQAMDKLGNYICNGHNGTLTIDMHHSETAGSLMGHCCEMEGNYKTALYFYTTSLKIIPTNNAANHHVRRIQARRHYN
ncbi:uncharacterized protein LOC127879509 isoform X2 [Dreissena polymorpha]|nr:uncharacterized protein LOC127879509 isoform X2 [Dreissena polymorpha]XP_052282342.1 uncharacterized protein LOC127879509 isoform X2 [Dreissena polymorpha]